MLLWSFQLDHILMLSLWRKRKKEEEETNNKRQGFIFKCQNADQYMRRDQRTPEPLPGRQNIDIQTDQFVEELTDKPPQYEIGVQSDFYIDRSVFQKLTKLSNRLCSSLKKQEWMLSLKQRTMNCSISILKWNQFLKFSVGRPWSKQEWKSQKRKNLE